MSDGTSTLRFLDPDTYGVVGTVPVTSSLGSVRLLNELEWVEGEVFANIWYSDRVVRIDPATGDVTGWIDFSGLLDGVAGAEGADVLNGIARDPASGQLYVTGKLWPRLFAVELVPVAR